MSHAYLSGVRRTVACLSGALGIAILAMTAAQAFTFNDEQSNSSSRDNAVKFADPADRAKARMNGGTGDQNTIRSGSTTLQFGGRESFDQRYSPNRYFDSNTLMGR